jgi:hypothetical protein
LQRTIAVTQKPPKKNALTSSTNLSQRANVTALAKLLGKEVSPDVLGVPVEDAMAV